MIYDAMVLLYMFVALHGIALHGIALHGIALHGIALRVCENKLLNKYKYKLYI